MARVGRRVWRFCTICAKNQALFFFKQSYSNYTTPNATSQRILVGTFPVPIRPHSWGPRESARIPTGGLGQEGGAGIQNYHNFINILVQSLIFSADCRESRCASFESYDENRSAAAAIRALLLVIYCRGQAIPNEKKNFLSTGPETRRKRSVCSRASKCIIERVSY